MDTNVHEEGDLPANDANGFNRAALSPRFASIRMIRGQNNSLCCDWGLVFGFVSDFDILSSFVIRASPRISHAKRGQQPHVYAASSLLTGTKTWE